MSTKSGSVDSTGSYNLPRSGKRKFFVNIRSHRNALSKGKVLVLEGEEVLKTRVCLMLASCGYEPVVHEGRSFSDLFNNGGKAPAQFAAVILDLHLPHSVQIANDLIKSSPGTRLILSGFDGEEGAPAELKDSCSGILKKPYGISELKRVLHEPL